jgi:predicted pyridoxine 5'-phosphate oxidase superfamily flavin-nucleotide-binding protein
MSMPQIGFHSGEPAVQRRAEVEAQASRLSRMVGTGELCGGVAALLEVAPFAAITARDRNGRLWISPLTGPRGFLAARTPTTLAITSELPGTDPVHGLEMGQPVGVVVMDFAAKRRARINGTLTATDRDVLEVDVAQAYGNCPQYIRPRRLDSENQSAAADFVVHRGESMDDDDVEPVGSADTFFLGIAHPERSNDASRRGGPAGLVHADHYSVEWPDFAGNNMFNSFGNLAVDPTAALLFVEFETGRSLHLSGRATLQWSTGSDDTRCSVAVTAAAGRSAADA